MKKKYLISIVTLLVLFFNTSICFSSNIIYVSKIGESCKIGNKIEIIKDSLSTLAIEDIVNLNFFIPNLNNQINKPSGGTYWIKIKIKNDLNTSIKKYLRLTSNDISYIEFYQLDHANSLKKKRFTGNKRNFKSRSLSLHDFTFPIALEPQELNYIYLKLERKYHTLSTDILLENDISLIKKTTNRSFKSGFTIGSILLYLLIALVLFVFNRKAINFNYLLYIVGATIFMLSFNDGLRYVWSNWPYFQDPSSYIGPTMIFIGHIGIFRLFFDVKNYNKKLDLFFQVFRVFGVFLIIGFLFTESIGRLYYILFQIMGLMYLISFILFIIVGFLIYLKRKRTDHIWFLVSIIFMVLSTLIIFLVELGSFNRREFEFAFNNLPLITLYYEAGILAFFLIKNLYDEKLTYERKVVEERQAIVEDLHDNVISSFGGLKTSFSNLMYEDINDSIKDKISNIYFSIEKTLFKLRDYTHSYNNSNKNLNGIIADVRVYANEILEGKKIKFNFKFRVDNEEFELPVQVSRNLKGFLKEVIYNTTKHSKATSFYMHVLSVNNIISIDLSDNGVGFDMTKKLDYGIGLKNLENRAKKMQASKYTLSSKPNLGMTVSLVIDLNCFNKSDYI